jgi:hypothetical protein
MALQGIYSAPAATRGSYIALTYAPLAQDESFVPVIDADGKLIISPTGLNGWLLMPSIAVASRNYTITPSESKQGELYEMAITGTIANATPQALQEFKRMKRMEFAVRINTWDGTTWLMMDLQYPASFSFVMDGGDAGSNRTKIKITFKGKMPYPPYKTV